MSPLAKIIEFPPPAAMPKRDVRADGIKNGLQPFAPNDAGRYSGCQKLGAKNIRTELARAFPGVKFSVTIRTRGTSAIDIRWTDGPDDAAVEKVTSKYNEGSFDGMTDSYDYARGEEAEFTNNFGGARYVHTSRAHGFDYDAIKELVRTELYPGRNVREVAGNYYDECSVVNVAFHHAAIPLGWEVCGIAHAARIKPGGPPWKLKIRKANETARLTLPRPVCVVS